MALRSTIEAPKKNRPRKGGQSCLFDTVKDVVKNILRLHSVEFAGYGPPLVEGQPLIANIQLLRFVAAFGVAVLHVGLVTDTQPEFVFGHSGVDVFFVISGFIMVTSSQRLFEAPGAAATFLWRRVKRVIPLYWLATCAYFVIQAAIFFPTLSDAISQDRLLYLASSLLFLPIYQPVPILPPGWTLAFEMMFYLLFSLALRFRQRIALPLVAIALSAAVALYIRDLLLEFIWGMALGALYVKNIRVPRDVAAIITAVGCFLLHKAVTETFVHRGILVGLPAAMVVFGAIYLPQAPLTGRIGWLVKLLGNASYPLYLIHWIVFVSLKDWGLSHPTMLIAAVAGSIACQIAEDALRSKNFATLRMFTHPAAQDKYS